MLARSANRLNFSCASHRTHRHGNSMQQRAGTDLCEHRESIRFGANYATTSSQSSSRSSSKQAGEGKFHLQHAADRQFVGGDNKRSREAAIPCLSVSVMNTMIFSLPVEADRCCQSITIVLPFIQGAQSASAFCDKVSAMRARLKTNKVRARIRSVVPAAGCAQCISAGAARNEP